MKWKKPLIYGCGGCVMIFGLISIISGIVVAIQALNEPPEPQEPPEPIVGRADTGDPSRRPVPQPRELTPPQPRRREDNPPARVGDATNAKEVWLYDSELKIPFCRVAVPGDWEVEGNVAWNYNIPLSPDTLWMRFSNRRLGVTAEVMREVGAFTWQDMLERLTGLRDGTYLTDTGMFMLKYRTARAALEEFIAPLVRQMNPSARIAWIRDDPENAEALRRERMVAMRASGAIANWHEFDFTAASMLVEDGRRKTLFVATTICHIRRMPMNNYYHWEWPGLAALTLDGDVAFTEQDLAALMRNVTYNPEWTRRALSIAGDLQGRGAATITRIHEGARRAIRQSGEVTEKWAGKWSDYIRDESNYAAPSGQIFKGPSTNNFGYLNGFGDAVVFTDQQISAANLNGYGEILRLD